MRSILKCLIHFNSFIRGPAMTYILGAKGRGGDRVLEKVKKKNEKIKK